MYRPEPQDGFNWEEYYDYMLRKEADTTIWNEIKVEEPEIGVK